MSRHYIADNYRTVVQLSWFILCSLLVIANNSNLLIEKADFYISPSGDDNNPGTMSAPFATLTAAQKAVRRLKQNHKGNILVYLRGGNYRLSETLVFTLEDSAGDKRTITYAAYPGETPVFSSDVPIPKWKKIEKGVDGLKETDASLIWESDLPKELKPFFTLYSGDKALPRARSAGVAVTNEAWKSPDRRTIEFPEGTLKKWSNPDQIEVIVRPSAGWTMNILPLDTVDEEKNIARTLSDATYPIGYLWGKRQSCGQPNLWVENALQYLDELNEWVLDFENRKLYYRPDGDVPPENIAAPQLTEFIRIEGEIDYDGPADKPVQNLIFYGLSFTRADRYVWERNRIGLGLQHDWEMFDRPSAVVRLRGTERCVFNSCRFYNAGGTGIRLDLFAQHNHIINSRFEHLGGAGVLLAGYGPGTKDVNKHNEIANNHIHHVGVHYWHSPAIFVWQSGENRIANNLIHHTPYTGIVVSGRIGWDRTGNAECSKTVRWKELGSLLSESDDASKLTWNQREPFLHGRNNVIERNEIHDVMGVMEDGNCIYISGTGKGNRIRENYLHHNLSPYMESVIRCDDDQYQTVIERNILFKNCGNGIAIKGSNDIVNNIIADLCSEDKLVKYISLEVESPKGAAIQQNILYSFKKHQIICGEELFYGKGVVPQLRQTRADYNLYFSSVDPDWGRMHIDRERNYDIELHSLAECPQFKDVANGCFDLNTKSPAFSIGFEAIDTRHIGLDSTISREF